MIFYRPQHSSVKKSRKFQRSSTPLLMLNQIVDKLEVIFRAASLDKNRSNNHFFKCCSSFDDGIFETTKMIKDKKKLKNISGWHVPLNVSIREPKEETEAKIREKGFLFVGRATNRSLNTQTSNAKKNIQFNVQIRT